VNERERQRERDGEWEGWVNGGERERGERNAVRHAANIVQQHALRCLESWHVD